MPFRGLARALSIRSTIIIFSSHKPKKYILTSTDLLACIDAIREQSGSRRRPRSGRRLPRLPLDSHDSQLSELRAQGSQAPSDGNAQYSRHFDTWGRNFYCSSLQALKLVGSPCKIAVIEFKTLHPERLVLT
jgi:hypothetical protein